MYGISVACCSQVYHLFLNMGRMIPVSQTSGIFSSFRMALISSCHLPWLQHGLNFPCTKCQVRDSGLSGQSLSQSGIRYIPRHVVGFRNNYFSQDESVSLTPNPQPGRTEIPLLSGPSPSTCPTRLALPVAVATDFRTDFIPTNH